MKNIHTGCKAFSVIILVLAFASLAHAGPGPAPAASRTWVSNSAGASDMNPCSRTMPCLTFSGALGKTAAGGEIDALDPGDFGTVTIGKSITIDGTTGAGFASITMNGGGPGLIIDAAVADVVTIRNLSINGPNGAAGNGVAIFHAGTVHIENCLIYGMSGNGINDGRSGNSASVFYLYVKDTIVRSCPGFDGMRLVPDNSVFLIVSLSNVRLQDNGYGAEIFSGVYASLDHCNISGNLQNGLSAIGNAGGAEGNVNAASVTVTNSVVSGNGNGIIAFFSAIFRVSGVQVFNNTQGLKLAGGAINSYGNNEIDGNTTDGAPSNTIPRK
jgi:hypothetical protein